MTKEYDDNFRGVLFKNDKQGNEKRPDYKGRIMVAGEEYWLSAWIKTPRSGGQKFMSLSVEDMEAKYKKANKQQEMHAQDGGAPDPEFDDEIPF